MKIFNELLKGKQSEIRFSNFFQDTELKKSARLFYSFGALNMVIFLKKLNHYIWVSINENMSVRL